MALGLPMILMGDEMRRSQNGNNNRWCQDNETGWLGWTLLSKFAVSRKCIPGGYKLPES